jgi:hypothetical protein
MVSYLGSNLSQIRPGLCGRAAQESYLSEVSKIIEEELY